MSNKLKFLLLLPIIFFISCSSGQQLQQSYKKIQIGDHAMIEIPVEMKEEMNRVETINGNKEFHGQYHNDLLHLEFESSKNKAYMDEYGELTQGEIKYGKEEAKINGKDAIIYFYDGNKFLYFTKNVINFFLGSHPMPNYENNHKIYVLFPNYSNGTKMVIEFNCFGDDGKQLAQQIIKSIKFD